MQFIYLFAAVLACAAILAPARGAESADCTGLVLDENGVPVLAAPIRLQQNGGKLYQTETDGAGRFTLRGIPPGDYRVEVHKEGFFLLTGQTLTLRPGPNEITLTLNHEQEVHEQVQVVATPNQVDPEDTAQRTTLTARHIRDIPVASSHILQQSLVGLPEIVRDNRNNLHVAGARSGETQYLLDGFEIGDPVSGALTARFNIDATRAAEVQTGRFGAGYAHAGAGILSLETPDGDDRWRFGTTNPIPGINMQQETHLGNWYPRFAFSGPIQRGRLWFSDSVSVQHNFSVVRRQRSEPNTTTEWAGDNLLRLQYNVTPKHILHASFLYNQADHSNLGLDAQNPKSTTLDARRRRAFTSLKDQVWLQDTLFEFGVAADSGELDYIPHGTRPYILLIDGARGNYFQQLHQRGGRLQAMGSMTAASRQWHGMHQVSGGLNLAGVTNSQSSRRGEIDVLRANRTLVRRTTFAGPAHLRISNTQAGGYVQDTWSISKRLVLQGGMRTDWDRFTQSAMAEPRLSANVLPFADDRAKLSLGWGIYNAPLNLSVIAQAYDQEQLDTFYDAAGKVAVLGPVVSQFVLPATRPRQPRFTITSAGWQEKIGRGTIAGVELLARDGAHGFAYVDQQPAQRGGNFLLQDQRKDRYRAATFSGRQIFSETTEVYTAYTRSRTRSNQVLNPVAGSIFYAAQQSAPVAWDIPNRVVSWGWTPTHIWGVQFSYFFEYRTGYPFSVVNLEQQLVGAPNRKRYPPYINLNLALEKKIGFRGYLWAARIEAVNALGRKNSDVVVNNIDAPNFGTFAGGQGRAFTLRVRFVGRK